MTINKSPSFYSQHGVNELKIPNNMKKKKNTQVFLSISSARPGKNQEGGKLTFEARTAIRTPWISSAGFRNRKSRALAPRGPIPRAGKGATSESRCRRRIPEAIRGKGGHRETQNGVRTQMEGKSKRSISAAKENPTTTRNT